jgi:Flp pilus assembly protein TadG
MHARRSREEGMTTTEVAILFPAVLFLLMLIVQYGLWWHGKQVADAAAAEAAAAARVPSGTEDAGTSAAEVFLSEAGNLTDIIVTVDRGPDVVTVTVTGRAPQLVPGYAWAVTARSVVPVEQFLDPAER